MEIAVIGAGIAGSLAAWRLRLLGHEVTLFDVSTVPRLDGCSGAAGGMVQPFTEGATSEPVVCQMGERTLCLWPAWCRELDVAWGALGTIVVASEHGELLAFGEKIATRCPQAKISSLDEPGLAQHEPTLAKRWRRALWIHDEGWLDPLALLVGLGSMLRQLGVTCQPNAQASLNVTQVSWRVADTIAAKPFDFVVDARGLAARDEVFNAEKPYPPLRALRGVRGEIVTVHCPDVQLKRPVRLLHPRHPIYVVPRANGHFTIGATQLESEDRSPISVQGMLELLATAAALDPGFFHARVIDARTELRPAYPDNIPTLEFYSRGAAINGLYRHGYLASPTLIENLCEHVGPAHG